MTLRHGFGRSRVSLAALLLLSTATVLGVGACSDDGDDDAPTGEAGADGSSGGAAGEGNESGAGGAVSGEAGAPGGGSGGSQNGGSGEGGGSAAGGAQGEGGSSAGGADGEGGEGGDSGIPDDGADDASSARYRLMHRGSGKCASMSAAKSLDVVDCNDADDTQEFFIDPGQVGGVRVRSASQTNQCIQLSDQGAVATTCSKENELEFVKRPNGGMQLKKAGGSCLIEVAAKLGAGACDDAADWEPKSAGEDFAIAATFSATTTFDGYSVDYLHDGNIQLGLAGQSWTNAWNTPDLPATIDIDLGEPRQFSRIDFYTSTGYEISAFDIDWHDGNAWNSIAVVTGNTQGHLVYVFPAVVARQLRIIARSGSSGQTNWARVNEVMIH
jgi:hypothetical protein